MFSLYGDRILVYISNSYHKLDIDSIYAPVWEVLKVLDLLVVMWMSSELQWSKIGIRVSTVSP